MEGLALHVGPRVRQDAYRREATAEAGDANADWLLGIGAATLDEARDVCIEGDAGLLHVLDRRKIRHKWNRSLFELTFLDSGSKASCFSGEYEDTWRGPSFHWVWADELAKWSRAAACWDVLYAAVRAGTRPRIIIDDAETDASLAPHRGHGDHRARGSTRDNEANWRPVLWMTSWSCTGDTPFAPGD